ncbi:hypothetical protein BJY01DRAFT_240598 [Aspergillus pseudoustus]|uniref:Uncharacterized protein n=1 Tax=Aspergillus pseudoustus TaxID=1810923 RepID=A0ABR4IPF3_9EURO
MSTDRGDNIPPYIDPSTVPIGRELGILFGFISASLVIMAVYTVLWRGIERREEDRDRLRKERLVAQGVHHGRGGLHEKMLDQEVLRARAEDRSIPRRARGDGEIVRSRGGSRMREVL